MYLPFDDFLREILIDELEVVRLQLFDIGKAVALAVQVVRVEGANGLQHLLVVIVHELAVGALLMPGVEGVVADHGQGLERQSGLVLDDVVEVLVVAPGQQNVVQTAARGIDTVLGAVDRIMGYRGYQRKSLGKMIRSSKAQPTGNVSPTTSHWPSDRRRIRACPNHELGR